MLLTRRLPDVPPGHEKPVIGVLCCNEVRERPIQAVASRFIEPISTIAHATVLLVPALPDSLDAVALASRLDGLLMTGSRSNVAASRYGGCARDDDRTDERRDEVALALSARMIESGKPVFGICRGLQELNVLFGGTLASDLAGHQRCPVRYSFEEQFEHLHDVTLQDHGLLATATGRGRLTVNSVHEQGIDRLGGGLDVEAVAVCDGLVEAFSARPCGAPVLAVQWHPEWDAAENPAGRAFFEFMGAALRRTDDSSARASRSRPGSPIFSSCA